MRPALLILCSLLAPALFTGCSKPPASALTASMPVRATDESVAAETAVAGNACIYIGVAGPAAVESNAAQRTRLRAEASLVAQSMLGLAFGADVVADGDNLRLKAAGFSTRGSSTRNIRELPDGSVLVQMEAPLPQVPESGVLGSVSLVVPLADPGGRRLSFSTRFQRELADQLKLLMKKHQVTASRVHLRSMTLVNPDSPEAVRIELLLIHATPNR